MCHRALLAWRLPPGLKRCRVTRPDDALSGATPHRWAQAASDLSRSGLSPAATSNVAAVSMPTPVMARSSGAPARTSRGDHCIETFELALEGGPPTGQRAERGLRGRRDRVGAAARAQTLASGHKDADGKAFEHGP